MSTGAGLPRLAPILQETREKVSVNQMAREYNRGIVISLTSRSRLQATAILATNYEKSEIRKKAPFATLLVLGENGKVTFDFPPREEPVSP